MTALDSSALFQQLLPKLTELEKKRKKVNSKAQVLSFVTIGLVFTVIVVASYVLSSVRYFNPGLLVPYIIVLILGCIGFLGYRRYLLEQFKLELKSIVINHILKVISPNLEYKATKTIHLERFKESGLFSSRIDSYRGKDFITGMFGETVFQLSEVHAEKIQHSSDSDGNNSSSRSTIFKGLFMVADFHKNFRGTTYVLPDYSEKMLGSWFSRKIQSSSLHDAKLIQMEDAEFEKEFKIYSSDPIEARYILSPKLMRDILSLKYKFSAPIYLSFIHSNVYVGITAAHSFTSINLRTSLLDVSVIEKLAGSILYSLNIIEDLDLNTRIWSKQSQ